MKKNVIKVIAFIVLIWVGLFFINSKDGDDKVIAEKKKDGEITDKIPILTFHRLVPDDVKKEVYPTNQWVGSVKVFEEMISYLHDNGYKTISTEEFYDWYSGKVEFDKKTVVITFDDGFYEDYYLALPILKPLSALSSGTKSSISQFSS